MIFEYPTGITVISPLNSCFSHDYRRAKGSVSVSDVKRRMVSLEVFERVWVMREMWPMWSGENEPRMAECWYSMWGMLGI